MDFIYTKSCMSHFIVKLKAVKLLSTKQGLLNVFKSLKLPWFQWVTGYRGVEYLLIFPTKDFFNSPVC